MKVRQEARRQFIHYFFGSVFIALVALRGMQDTLAVLVSVFLVGLVVSYLIKKGVKVPLFFQVARLVERDYEKHLPGKGALLFFLGAMVLMALFQNQSVVLGALCVAIYGDAASTIFGLRFGKHRIAGKKTLEGTLGGILVSVIFLGFLFEWWVALIAAVAGMLAELLPFDDNFTIPIAAALALTILI